jgi:nucleoside-diphosphate-sugar epimerase
MPAQTSVLVTGAGAFIGHHMFTFLTRQGYWVRGVDIKRLAQSDLGGPANVDSEEHVTVAELVHTEIDVSGKAIEIEYVEGPLGLKSLNFGKDYIYSPSWRPGTSLKAGIASTYPGLRCR